MQNILDSLDRIVCAIKVKCPITDQKLHLVKLVYKNEGFLKALSN